MTEVVKDDICSRLHLDFLVPLEKDSTDERHLQRVFLLVYLSIIVTRSNRTPQYHQ